MLDILKLIIAFFLGVVEGITEFLPISSTAHVILIASIFGNSVDNDSIQIFIVIVQLGAILAVLMVFWNKLRNIIVNCIPNIFLEQHHKHNHLCFRHIFIGTLPGTLFGMFFYEKIKLLFFDPLYIVYGLISGGVLMLIGEFYLYRTPLNRTFNIDNITNIQALLIGCFQCLAFWPGFSRSGATIGSGLFLGLSRRVASEFSFILAIPIILGSSILTMYHYKTGVINITNVLVLIIGSTTACVIALFIVKLILKIIQHISLIPFIIYRFLLAIIIYCGLVNKDWTVTIFF